MTVREIYKGGINEIKILSCDRYFSGIFFAEEIIKFIELIRGIMYMSASSRIEQLTPINFEHFRSQTCSGDASYGSWLHSCERPPLDAEYGLG